MWTYEAPLRDIRYVLEEWLDVATDWGRIPALGEMDLPTALQVIAEAGNFVTSVLAPLNSSADLEGCRFVDGTVSTPKGFPEAYRAFIQGGWPGLSCAADYGGQGLPQLLNFILYEMMCAANHGFAMYPGISHGAYECLRANGSNALQERYLASIVSGEALVTMCLTESHAGSDLGLLRSRAEPEYAGTVNERYRINGTKIFISGGAHDLSLDIVHLVLARLPDAPAGTRGLSLFLVPQRLSPGDGANAVRCDGIEKKMGIKGSATCVMTFDGAIGWRIGEPNRGLAAMFVMMNGARLHVAMQGLAHAEAAYQNAAQYAAQRLQMRAQARPADTRESRVDPIASHPPIRHAILELRAFTQGERAAGYWIAHLLDLAEHHPDPQERASSHRLASLLTPLAKAFFTENGFQLASRALQVFGGHGYVHENAIEQTLRDSRITMIYEGTNEIQAIDLLLRKVLADGGQAFELLLDHFAREVELCNQAGGAEFATQLSTATRALRSAIAELTEHTAADPELPYRAAADFNRALGLVLLAFTWLRSARLAQPRAASDPFYRDKLVTARYFFDYLFPAHALHLQMMRVTRKGLPCLDVG